MVIVLMGVAGAGKTTVGQRLAAALGWPFHDGDDFHQPEAVARMRGGQPLDDALRAPWLAALGDLIAGHLAAGTSAVVACSALRRAYRDVLRPIGAPRDAVRLVYLRVPAPELERRLTGRTDHFFTSALLASQLAALEEPGDDEQPPVLTVDAAAPLDTVVARVREAVGV